MDQECLGIALMLVEFQVSAQQFRLQAATPQSHKPSHAVTWTVHGHPASRPLAVFALTGLPGLTEHVLDHLLGLGVYYDHTCIHAHAESYEEAERYSMEGSMVYSYRWTGRELKILTEIRAE